MLIMNKNSQGPEKLIAFGHTWMGRSFRVWVCGRVKADSLLAS